MVTLMFPSWNRKNTIYSCKLFGTYPCSHKQTKDFQKVFPWPLYEKVSLLVCKFSNRRITSGLNNGCSKTGVVNWCCTQWPKQLSKNKWTEVSLKGRTVKRKYSITFTLHLYN